MREECDVDEERNERKERGEERGNKHRHDIVEEGQQQRDESYASRYYPQRNATTQNNRSEDAKHPTNVFFIKARHAL